MDLADFPLLKLLNLEVTAVTGDIREIRANQFSSLESLLYLPKSVQGGVGYEFQLISDVPGFMQAIHLLLQLQHTPTLFDEDLLSDEDFLSDEDLLSRAFYWSLSEGSPNWYDWDDGYDWDDESESPPPPFRLQFIQAGSRRGWSWCTLKKWSDNHSCEINWLDPEPSSESSDYQAYIDELQQIERRVDFYRGYRQPPTEQEYRRLCERLP